MPFKNEILYITSTIVFLNKMHILKSICNPGMVLKDCHRWTMKKVRSLIVAFICITSVCTLWETVTILLDVASVNQANGRGILLRALSTLWPRFTFRWEIPFFVDLSFSITKTSIVELLCRKYLKQRWRNTVIYWTLC